ncbi:MAG: hypothetical protein ACTSRI_21265 [Promethearchaeota archaeon]
MNSLNDSFQKVKNSSDSEQINDFLIDLSQKPCVDYLSYINYFIDNLNIKTLDKVKLSLVYTLGQIGNLTCLDDVYLKFLEDIYYNSDRWIRNEIIQAVDKIINQRKIPNTLIKIVSVALREDYVPIKLNALKILFKLDNLPNLIVGNTFTLLNLKDSELREQGMKVLNKFIHNEIELYKLMDNQQNYKILKKNAFRTILLSCFTSIIEIESFKKLILNSNWEIDYQEIFINEIDVFKRIMLKNL